MGDFGHYTQPRAEALIMNQLPDTCIQAPKLLCMPTFENAG